MNEPWIYMCSPSRSPHPPPITPDSFRCSCHSTPSTLEAVSSLSGALVCVVTNHGFLALSTLDM